MSISINHINQRFIYKGDKGDKWRILDVSKSTITGDCEDYILTVLFHVVCEGSCWKFFKAIITGKAQFFYVEAKTSSGRVGHAVMRVKGKGFIDNWSTDYVHKTIMTRELGHVFKYRLLPVEVFYRLFRGLF